MGVLNRVSTAQREQLSFSWATPRDDAQTGDEEWMRMQFGDSIGFCLVGNFMVVGGGGWHCVMEWVYGMGSVVLLRDPLIVETAGSLDTAK